MAPVCAEMEEAVASCFLKNESQSLKCAAEVHAFIECVNSQRQVPEHLTCVNVTAADCTIMCHKSACIH